MKIIETPIPGLLIIEPRVFADERGYFFESFSATKFAENGLISDFVQDNESKSHYGVIRGLHYQLAPYAQTKLIRVVRGTVYDVAVDLRTGSPTFGQWYGVIVSASNKRQFYIPKGFAHGFQSLVDSAEVDYEITPAYRPCAAAGFRFDDPRLAINWPVADMVISERDRALPPSFAGILL